MTDERPPTIAAAFADRALDSDVLTPTGKLRRRAMVQRYASVIDALHEGG